MTLKPIVASMFLMGLASSSAFAAVSNADTQAQLDSMKAKIAKMESVINQNQTGGFQQPNDWYKRITLSGLANVDLGGATRNPVSMADGGTYDLSLNSAILLMDANVSDWTKVHLAFGYEDSKAFDRNEFLTVNDTDPTDPEAVSYTIHTAKHRFLLDEAYITLGNLAKNPMYARLGRQYIPFGVYQRYPMTASLTQLLTQTRATAATLGFVDASGFYGSAYVFRGDTTQVGDSFHASGRTRLQNFGGNLGFAGAANNMGYKIDVSAIRNMADTELLSALVGDNYIDPVAGMSAHVGVNSGPFDMSADYVTALRSFNAGDAWVGVNDNGSYIGGKPSAWGAEIGYTLATMGHASRISLGYQGSKNIDGIYNAKAITPGGSFNVYAMPKQRYIANYTVNVSQYTDIGVQVYNDRGYGYGVNGVTGKNNATVGLVRLGVKFA